jgi:cephalosporin-C deacetylase
MSTMNPEDAPRYTEAELLRVQPPDTEPPDFEAFWRETWRLTAEIAPDVRVRDLWSPDASVTVAEVSFASWGGYRIGAWMTVPQEPRGAVVVGHGYGGRAWLDMEYAARGFAAIFPCARGFHLSSNETLPWQAAEHVVHGIESRETYLIRGCVADFWLAATVLRDYLRERCGEFEPPLAYSGGSFGGGIGALMLPWDERFRAAFLEVPTFGNHPVRLGIPSTGSAESVRRYATVHPEVSEVLAYYDAATAAKRITIPTLCAPAVFDPAVTPEGQFAVANALANAEIFVQPSGHYIVPGLEEVQARLLERVFVFLGEQVASRS